MAAVFGQSAIAQDGRPNPFPRPREVPIGRYRSFESNEQYVSRNIDRFVQSQTRIQLVPELGLRNGDEVSQVVIIAQGLRGEGYSPYPAMSLQYDGYTSWTRSLSSYGMEVFTIPFRQSVQQGRAITIVTEGSMMIASIGVIKRGYSSPGPGPGPIPQYGCEIIGYGSYNGYTWNFRLKSNGQIVEGSDSFETILTKLASYESNNLCRVQTQNCKLTGYGSYRGYSWNYRFSVGSENIVLGSDSRATILGNIKTLQNRNVCSTYNYSQCSLLGAGSYRGYSWNYRVAIDGEIVDATDSNSTAMSIITEFRTAGLCR